MPTTSTLCGPDDLQRNVAVLPANTRGVPQDVSHGTCGRCGIDDVVHDAHLDRALDLADSPAKGAVVASDAFFPFADGLEAVAEAGAVAVIQPGGSVRDDEVIAAADAAGIAMVFTGVRHFRH